MSNVKVKFNDHISSVEGSFSKGQVVSLAPDRAKAWCGTGQASLVEEVEPVTPVVDSAPVSEKDVAPVAEPKPSKKNKK